MFSSRALHCEHNGCDYSEDYRIARSVLRCSKDANTREKHHRYKRWCVRVDHRVAPLEAA
jgi:hypothetical protein